MILDERPYTLDRTVRLAIVSILTLGGIWLVRYLSPVLLPFVTALLIAYMIDPLVTYIQGLIKNRHLAILVSFVLIIIVSGLAAWLAIPAIVSEIRHTSKIISDLVNNSTLAEHAAKRLPPDLWLFIKDQLQRPEVRDFFKTANFWKMVETALQKLVPGMWGVFTGTASFIMGLFGLLIIFLYLIFILIDYEKIKTGWKDLVPALYRDQIESFIRDFDSAMSRHFRSQAEIAAIVGILHAIGFYLIGLPMSLLMGIFIGLLNMVPYLQIVGMVPAFLLAFVHALNTGASFLSVLGQTALVFAVVQVIQDAFLVPKIQGKATGLSPAMILLSLSIWSKLLGFLGLIIALPLTCLLLAYYKRLIARSEAVKLQETT